MDSDPVATEQTETLDATPNNVTDAPEETEPPASTGEPRAQSGEFILQAEGLEEPVTMELATVDFSQSIDGGPVLGIYIDTERYESAFFEGEYRIVPIGSGEEPLCSLNFFFVPGKTAGEYAEERIAEPKDNVVGMVNDGEVEVGEYTATLLDYLRDGEAEQLYVIDTGSGCIVIAPRIPSEYAEGLGARLYLSLRTIHPAD